jgi:hypothetical protein
VCGCCLCFESRSPESPIEVYHAAYEGLGDGARGDLIAFCGACHLDVENFLRRRRCGQQRPIRADVSCMRDARAKLFDPTRQESAVLSHR